MQNNGRTWIFLGALLGALAVTAGAFGAHGLKSRFAADGELTHADEQQLANWETAARYQMYHALALVAVGLVSSRGRQRLLDVAALSFLAGTAIFSGLLYVLVLTGERWLGAIVPIGGTLLIVGWITLAVAAWRLPAPSTSSSSSN